MYIIHLSVKKADCNIMYSYIKVPFEIEPQYLLTEKKEIFFSATSSEGYQLYTLKGRSVKVWENSLNTFKPFMLKGSVAGLQDHDGNEDFHITDNTLKPYIGNAVIKSLFSFHNGYLILVQLKEDGSVLLIDLKRQVKKLLPIYPTRLHSAVCPDDSDIVVLNYDTNLVFIDLKEHDRLTNIFVNNSGTKMNPFLKGKEVYFSDNSNSEYHRIFKISLEDRSYIPHLLHRTDHDIRLPKIKGDELFYIEVINSEYLLKALNLQSGYIRSITNKGVVYNYDFDNEGIIFSYTDFNTPKAICRYSNGFQTNLTGTSSRLNLTYRFIKGDKSRSPAYIISPPLKAVKGIIIYLHPGLNDDFSPRWNAVIMNLSNNGYLVVCPNYPMSSGYGKVFNNADMDQAVRDILNWKQFIQAAYKDIPLFYCSSSSGNMVMEQAVATDKRGVRAAVSFFGVPSDNQKTFPVPGLFILGGNDPVIDFTNRSKMLESMDGRIEVSAYPSEGHWFRKEINLYDAVNRVLNFFCRTR